MFALKDKIGEKGLYDLNRARAAHLVYSITDNRNYGIIWYINDFLRTNI